MIWLVVFMFRLWWKCRLFMCMLVWLLKVWLFVICDVSLVGSGNVDRYSCCVGFFVC